MTKQDVIDELAAFMVKNAADDYVKRQRLAAADRRRACIMGEFFGESYSEIAKKLIDIDKKYGLI